MQYLRVPADFWDRDDVRHALRRRSFRDLLRLIQAHLGASQTMIAAACGITQGQVSQIITGKKAPAAYHVIERILAGLTMPPQARALLGFSSAPPADQPTDNADTPHHEPDQPRTVLEFLIRRANRTYEETAASLHLSPRHLARLARGEREADSDDLRPSTRRLLQSAFNVPADLLLQPWTDHSRAALVNLAYDTGPQHANPLLVDAGNHTFGPHGLHDLVLDDDPINVILMSDGQITEGHLSRRVFTGLVAGLIASSLPGTEPTVRSSRHVDPSVVDHLKAHRSLLVDADSRFGGHTVLPTVKLQTLHIASLRRDTTGALRRELLRTEARWAEFAGWLSDDLGDQAGGAKWLDLALDMSHEADDPEFVSYILARKAQRAVLTSDVDRVLSLAQAAARNSHGNTLVHAFATTQAAYGNALTGNQQEFERAIEQAQYYAAQPAADSDLASFCTDHYIAACEAEGWLQLQKYDRALAQFACAMTAWPQDYQRERGLTLARIANTHIWAGNLDEAVDAARQAMPLAAATQSSRIRRQLELVVQRAAPHDDHPEIRALLDDLGGERW